MKNQIVITPLINNKVIIEDNEILTTPNIDSINNDFFDGEIYDHLFYIDNAIEVFNYESYKDACILLFDMTKCYFDDYPDIDSVLLRFCNDDNNNLYTLLVEYNCNEDCDCDYDSYTVSLFGDYSDDTDSNKDEEQLDECDECITDSYFFGFGW